LEQQLHDDDVVDGIAIATIEITPAERILSWDNTR
jgi:hypothetical protein